MIKKRIGQVTVEEKNEIQTLYERSNGLNELAQILTSENDGLYEKLVKDMAKLAVNSMIGGIVWARNTSGKVLKEVIGR